MLLSDDCARDKTPVCGRYGFTSICPRGPASPALPGLPVYDPQAEHRFKARRPPLVYSGRGPILAAFVDVAVSQAYLADLGCVIPRRW